MEFVRLIKNYNYDEQITILDTKITKLQKFRDEQNIHIGRVIQNINKGKSFKDKVLIKNTIVFSKNLINRIDVTLDILYNYYSELYEEINEEIENNECCQNCNEGKPCCYDYGDYWD